MSDADSVRHRTRALGGRRRRNGNAIRVIMALLMESPRRPVNRSHDAAWSDEVGWRAAAGWPSPCILKRLTSSNRDKKRGGRGAAATTLALAIVLATWAGGPLAQPQEEQARRTLAGPVSDDAPPGARCTITAQSRSVTGPCPGVLHWLLQEGEEGWVRRCEAASKGRGMTHGGSTHSCREWIAICRSNPGYMGRPIKTR